jgi:hypothetical protein
MPEKLDSLDEIHAQELFYFKRTRNRVPAPYDVGLRFLFNLT